MHIEPHASADLLWYAGNLAAVKHLVGDHQSKLWYGAAACIVSVLSHMFVRNRIIVDQPGD